MRWEKVTLSDVSSNIQTGPFGSQLHQSDYSDEGVPVIMPKDLVNGHISEKSAARVSTSHVDRLSRHKIESGDILYSRRGDVGRCALATEMERGWLCGTGCLRVTIDRSKAIPEFIFYQLQKAETIGWVEKHAVGSTMLNLNTAILGNIPIDLPQIEEQRAIVSILFVYDNLIENNQKQIKLLEEAAQRLYKEWFVDLRFPGYENTKIVDGVPEGWKQSCVQDVTRVLRRGISPQYSDAGNSLAINQKCIRQSIMDISEGRRQEKSYPDELNIEDSDIVVCSTGAGTLGRVGQVFGVYLNTVPDSHVTLIRGNDTIGKQYLYHTVKLKEKFLMGMGKGSTNQLELSRAVLQKLPILHPSSECMYSFETFAQSCHDKICILKNQYECLIEIRDRLISKLMNGEIELLTDVKEPM